MDGVDAGRGDRPAKSSAVGMRTAINGVFEYDAEVEWDSESGQFFCSYLRDGKLYNVWLEEANSINMRSSLAHKYALAGVSAWSRNFVIPEIWDVLNRNLKEIITYFQWQAEANAEDPGLSRVQQ
jgi:spore germination protein YaaH